MALTDDSDELSLPAPTAPEDAPAIFADSTPAGESLAASPSPSGKPPAKADAAKFNSELTSQKPARHDRFQENARFAGGVHYRSPFPIIALILVLISMLSLLVFLARNKNAESVKSAAEDAPAKTELATTQDAPVAKPAETPVEKREAPKAVPPSAPIEKGNPGKEADSNDSSNAKNGAQDIAGGGAPNASANDAKGATGGKQNGGVPNGPKLDPAGQDNGANFGGEDNIPNLGADPGEKILFEGRWIEKAVQQKRAAQLAQRAFEEAVAHYKVKAGESTRFAPFHSAQTVVTPLNAADSFLVIGRFQAPGKNATQFICEVQRTADGHWRIVHAHEDSLQ